MFKKLLAFIISFAFLAIINAETEDMPTSIIPPRPVTVAAAEKVTQCFTCYNPNSCMQPKPVICDQNSANSTRATLAKYFLNVSNATSPQFECVKLRYTLKKHVQLAVSGCINFGLNPCGLQPKNDTLASASHSCNSCLKNLCNPAGSFSSSLAIIMSAMFGLLLLKY